MRRELSQLYTRFYLGLLSGLLAFYFFGASAVLVFVRTSTQAYTLTHTHTHTHTHTELDQCTLFCIYADAP